MDHANCNHHVPCDPESGDTPQKSEDQTDAAEKFCVDGQQSEGPGNMHLLRKGINGAAESISAKPAEHLLCTVCKENGPKHKAENRQGEVVGSSHKPATRDCAKAGVGKPKMADPKSSTETNGTHSMRAVSV